MKPGQEIYLGEQRQGCFFVLHWGCNGNEIFHAFWQIGDQQQTQDHRLASLFCSLQVSVQTPTQFRLASQQCCFAMTEPKLFDEAKNFWSQQKRPPRKPVTKVRYHRLVKIEIVNITHLCRLILLNLWLLEQVPLTSGFLNENLKERYFLNFAPFQKFFDPGVLKQHINLSRLFKFDEPIPCFQKVTVSGHKKNKKKEDLPVLDFNNPLQMKQFHQSHQQNQPLFQRLLQFLVHLQQPLFQHLLLQNLEKNHEKLLQN